MVVYGKMMRDFKDLRFTQSALAHEASKSIDLSKDYDKKLDITKHQLSSDFTPSQIESNLEMGDFFADDFVNHLKSLV